MLVPAVRVHRLIMRPCSKLGMNFCVTLSAKAHQVFFIVGATVSQRYDVMYFLDLDVPSFFETSLAERVCLDVRSSDSLPAPTVSLAVVLVSAMLFVLLYDKLHVFLAVSTVSQSGTAGIGTRLLG